MIAIRGIKRAPGPLVDHVDIVAKPVGGDPEAGGEVRGGAYLRQAQLPEGAAQPVGDMHRGALVSARHKDGKASARRAFGQRNTIAPAQACTHDGSNMGANLIAGLGIPRGVKGGELIDPAMQNGVRPAAERTAAGGHVHGFGQHGRSEQVAEWIVM